MSRHLARVLCVAALALAGCGGPKAYVRPGFLDHPPRRVAVLPFVITYPYDLAADQARPAAHTVGRDVFRKTFYYALTPYGYEDVKLAEVDAALAKQWGPIESGAWRSASPKALGEALGVDALVYGELEHLMHFSTPLYTETSLKASLRMVDAASGEVLWRKQVQAADRGGVLFKKGQVVDFIEDQVSSFNPGVKFLRVSDLAVKRALKGFPNPPLAVDSQPGARVGAAREAFGVMRLAILPFETTHRNWQKAAETLRTGLTASLQEGPVEVLEIQRVDAALKTLGWKAGEPLPKDLSLPELARALGADALLRGTVTNWGRGYAVVESWVKAELALELVDPHSGAVIWSEKKQHTRQAGLLKGPTGYTSIATAPIMGLKASNLEMVATHLARSMAEDFNAAPAVLAYLSEKKP